MYVNPIRSATYDSVARRAQRFRRPLASKQFSDPDREDYLFIYLCLSQ